MAKDDDLFKNLDRIGRQRAAGVGPKPAPQLTSETPDAVALITPVWTDAVATDPRVAVLATVKPDDAGQLTLALRIPIHRPGLPPEAGAYATVTLAVRVGTPEVLTQPNGQLNVRCWGLRRLGPGVWQVMPGVPVPGLRMAFLVMTDVPDPAPFAPAPPEGDRG